MVNFRSALHSMTGWLVQADSWTVRDDSHLAGVRLGRRHANLAARVDVNATVGHARYGAAHRVGHAHAQRAAGFDVLQGLRKKVAPLGPCDGGQITRQQGHFPSS